MPLGAPVRAGAFRAGHDYACDDDARDAYARDDLARSSGWLHGTAVLVATDGMAVDRLAAQRARVPMRRRATGAGS